ncbi:MAG: OmpH family outer membrane protein [Paludibacteraceae bacterium]|nr:OmpH family outer membrane protein [Paludibacteraceae bacterium]
MRLFHGVILLFLLIFAPLSAQNTKLRLAHYDEEQVLKAMSETAEVERAIKSLGDQYEAEMTRMEEEYSRKAGEYQKGYISWDETIRMTRMEELHTMKTKMQNYYDMADQTLKAKRVELYAPVYKTLYDAVAKVAEQHQFLYVWDIKQIKYMSKDAVDITPMIKRELGIK